MSKQVFDVKLAEAEVTALDAAAEKFQEEMGKIKEELKVSDKAGMILAQVLLNSSHTLKDEAAFVGETEVDVVTLDSITGLDGEEIEFTEVGGKRFVPSFDSKEDGKYIIHYFVKDTEDKALLKLVASYDHNTKVVKADGEGWERCSIRIDLK